jgi:hypothetical protein
MLYDMLRKRNEDPQNEQIIQEDCWINTQRNVQ